MSFIHFVDESEKSFMTDVDTYIRFHAFRGHLDTLKTTESLLNAISIQLYSIISLNYNFSIRDISSHGNESKIRVLAYPHVR